jgi:hypothetical protein
MEAASLHSDQQTLVCPEESNVPGLATEIDRINQNQSLGTRQMGGGYRALEELYSAIEHIFGFEHLDYDGADSVIAKQCISYTAN